MASPDIPASDRSRVRRAPDRARYDRGSVHAILDEGLVAHVGIAVEGQPFVLPMAYGRDGERLILHGSVASRLMRGLGKGLPVCVTVTILDGLVLSRSAFHHSMNYRSVVVLGTARRLEAPAEVAAALDVLVEHVAPGRVSEVRPSNEVELRQTAVLEVPIDEASAKVRTGGPRDDPEDLELPVWAGVLPIGLVPGDPVAEADLPAGVAPSAVVTDWRRGRPPGPGGG